MIKKKIAIVHPHFRPGGGSEAKPLWIIETLKRSYDITLITMGRINLDEMNHAYGTDLQPNDCKIISIPIPIYFQNKFDALRGYRLVRYCKKHAADYDLIISTYNVMDFGLKGLQFIADFSFDDELRRRYDFSGHSPQNFLYRKSPARSIYLRIGELLGGFSKVGWKKNTTITNSDWSGRVMRETYGIKCKTLYPPVVGDFPYIPWDERENGFVILSRLSLEKKIERIIEILERVRNRGFDIHLHICGRDDNAEYVKKLKNICAEKRDWVFMEGLVVGPKKMQVIAQHKFSISARENEPFGISVAEAVKAGCITWVPNGGGQTEIVNHPSLIYNDIEDAVNKIERVLKNKFLQNELRIHLDSHAKMFTIEKFQEEIRDLVSKFLKNENARN